MREMVERSMGRQLWRLALATAVAALLMVTESRFSDPMNARQLAGAVGTDLGNMIVGRAHVVDGDTLEIGGVRIRLEGIDAPEAGQACARRWFGTWPCGRRAKEALAALSRDSELRCVARGGDRYGRVLGVCYRQGVDINADLVRRGLAWAFVKYSRSYVDQESIARASGAGIWQAPTQTAWEYRARGWRQAEAEAPRGCAIKGNITRNGRIYHMPWSPWYARIRIDEREGERWFCTEAEAIAAGWRPIAGDRG